VIRVKEQADVTPVDILNNRDSCSEGRCKFVMSV